MLPSTRQQPSDPPEVAAAAHPSAPKPRSIARKVARFAIWWLIAITVATGCIIAGVWQLHRYHEKHAMNQVLHRNTGHAPVAIDQLVLPESPVSKDLRYRQVTMTGQFDQSHQFAVRQRHVDDQPAFLVVTPFRTDNGPTLIVVRGWLPADGSATATPTLPPAPTQHVTVTGRLYPSEAARSQSGLPSGQIDNINTTQLAEQLNAKTYRGYIEQMSVRTTEPTPAASPDSLRTLPTPEDSNLAGGASEFQHVAYVVQWFLLAAIALAGPIIFSRIDKRADVQPSADQAPRLKQ